MLYVGSCSGSFYALDRHDGSPVWVYDTAADGPAENFHGNMAVTEHRIVVGTDSGTVGHLYAFDPATGAVRWSQSAEGGFPSDVATRDGRAFAVTMAGEARAIDLASGETVWNAGGVEGGRQLHSNLVLAAGRAFVSLPAGTVTAFDVSTGETAWETSLDARLNTSLAHADGAIWVGDLDGRIHRLAAEDGRVVGTFTGDGPVYGALTRAGECLLALSGRTTLACVTPDLKAVRWTREAPLWSSFEPLVHDGQVIAGTDAGEVRALDLATGETVWSTTLEGEIKSFALTGDLLYIGTLQGRLYALRIHP